MTRAIKHSNAQMAVQRAHRGVLVLWALLLACFVMLVIYLDNDDSTGWRPAVMAVPLWLLDVVLCIFLFEKKHYNVRVQCLCTDAPSSRMFPTRCRSTKVTESAHG